MSTQRILNFALIFLLLIFEVGLRVVHIECNPRIMPIFKNNVAVFASRRVFGMLRVKRGSFSLQIPMAKTRRFCCLFKYACFFFVENRCGKF